MKFRYCLLLNCAALAIIVACAACEVTDQGALTNGIFRVQLTGAPGEYDAVYIDIQKVRIKSNKLYYSYLSDDEEEKHRNNKGWTTINDEAVRVNLHDYQNKKKIEVASEELEAGVYDELRFVLGSDNSLIINGSPHALEIPNALQSGIPIEINAEIRDGETYNLLIDLNTERSIFQDESGDYILNPVLRVEHLNGKEP